SAPQGEDYPQSCGPHGAEGDEGQAPEAVAQLRGRDQECGPRSSPAALTRRPVPGRPEPSQPGSPCESTPPGAPTPDGQSEWDRSNAPNRQSASQRSQRTHGARG